MAEKIVKDSQCLVNDLANDCISRKAAINAVHEEFDDCLVWDESGKRTADEFEIIHCRNCRYWEREKPFATSGRCFIWECANRKGSDYCSEAREEGE